MTPEQKNRAREILKELLPDSGRSVPRDKMTRSKLSKQLGHTKDYIADFINGRKDSLGASEVSKIELALGLAKGWLLEGTATLYPSALSSEEERHAAEFLGRMAPEDRKDALGVLEVLAKQSEDRQAHAFSPLHPDEPTTPET